MSTTATSAIYRRLSKDRPDETSTVRQEADCRVRAEADGLEVAEVFTDLVSGYRLGAERPGFDAAVEWVCAAPGRTLYVWKLDRLSRRGIGQVGTVLDRVEAAHSRIVFVVDGQDTSVSSARVAIALLSELARSESENTSTRTRSALAGRKASGLWSGGRPPYGFRIVTRALKPGADPSSFLVTEEGTPGTLVADPDTAPVVRRIVARVLEGASTYAVTRELAADGIPAPRGGAWRIQTVATMLASPVLVGWLPSGKGSTEPARDPKTRAPIVCGEALITLADRGRLQKALALRSRVNAEGKRRSAGRKPLALLTGIARCDVCGSAMTGGGSKGNERYACTLSASGGGCVGNTASLRASEEYVVARCLARWAALDPADPVLQRVAAVLLGRPLVDPLGTLERDALAAERDEHRARLDDLTTLRLEPEFRGSDGAERFAALRDPLVAAIAQTEAALASAKAAEPNLAALLDPTELRGMWDAIDVDARRAALAATLDTVRVVKAAKPGQRWDAEARLRLEWTPAA